MMLIAQANMTEEQSGEYEKSTRIVLDNVHLNAVHSKIWIICAHKFEILVKIKDFVLSAKTFHRAMEPWGSHCKILQCKGNG